jgi:hypothetical protein
MTTNRVWKWSDALDSRQQEIVEKIRGGMFPLQYVCSQVEVEKLIETMDLADTMIPFNGEKYGIPRWMRESGLFTRREVDLFYRFGIDILGI